MEHGRRRARWRRLLAAGDGEGDGREEGWGGGVVTDVCDCCGARGRGLGGWISRTRRRTQGRWIQQHTPALRVRDKTAAAATWLDMARDTAMIQSGDIPKIYAKGGL